MEGMSKKLSLTVVLPCFNEEGVIAKTINNTISSAKKSKTVLELIVVDDGSTDDSGAILEALQKKHPCLRVLTNLCNQGYASAVCKGIDQARMDNVAFMDSDGQFLPKDLFILLRKMERNSFIAGFRKNRADPPHRKLNAFIFNSVIRILFGIIVKDIDCGLKIFKRKIWKEIKPVVASGALLNAELFLNLKNNHIAFIQMPVNHLERRTGKSTGAKISVICKAMLELPLLALHMQERKINLFFSHLSQEKNTNNL